MSRPTCLVDVGLGTALDCVHATPLPVTQVAVTQVAADQSGLDRPGQTGPDA